MNRIRNVRTSDSKIDKTPNKVTITCRVRKRITITSTKLDIELRGSLNSMLIPKSSTSKKILDIYFSWEIEKPSEVEKPRSQESSKEDQGTNTGRRRDKIPSASALKRSNLLGHGKLQFGMTLSIPIRSRLEGNRKTVLTRRVTIRWTTLTTRKRRENLIRGRRGIRGGSIGRCIRNMRATRIMEGKRRQW
jgi:hypothetical protein